MVQNKKKIVYIGRVKPTNIVAGEMPGVFYVKFNSITSEFEDEFTEIVSNFQRLGRAPLVVKLNEHHYKIQRTEGCDSVWEILLHKYMSCRCDLWKEIETSIEFVPVEVSFAA